MTTNKGELLKFPNKGQCSAKDTSNSLILSQVHIFISLCLSLAPSSFPLLIGKKLRVPFLKQLSKHQGYNLVTLRILVFKLFS